MRIKQKFVINFVAFSVFVCSSLFVLRLRRNPASNIENKFKKTEEMVKEYVNAAEGYVDMNLHKQRLKHSSDNLYPKTDKAKSEYEEYFTKRYLKQWEYHYEYKISGSTLCANKNPPYVVLVMSSPNNVERREAIRQTWSTAAAQNGALVIFVLANTAHTSEEVGDENSYYNDVIQLSFKDIYHNLVLKTVAGLNWILEFCNQVKFVVKTDDDMILNLNLIEKIVLQELDFDKNLIMGATARNNNVQRRGKWAVSNRDYPFDKFPQHVSGGVYVLAYDVIKQIAGVQEYLPRIPIEDVFITGIVRKALNIDVTDNDKFPTWLSRTPKSECKFIQEELIGLHGYGPTNMHVFWERFDFHDVDGC